MSNPTTVSIEAGVSRTLIGYDKCRYPNVRQAIFEKDAAADQLPVRVPTDMRAINEDLKQINPTVISKRQKLLSKFCVDVFVCHVYPLF